VRVCEPTHIVICFEHSHLASGKVPYSSILVAQVCQLIPLNGKILTGEAGNSGTYMVYERSAAFSTILRGQYDLIGFDPRGANKSSVCFQPCSCPLCN
jgi:hypothetical protein